MTLVDENVTIIDLGLLINNTLVLCDLHLGYEDMLADNGVFLPRYQFRETIQRLEAIMQEVDIKRVVINGDLKHDFGRISRQEWDDILSLIDYIRQSHDLILVRGNHDTMLDGIARQRSITIQESYQESGFFVLHGDRHFEVPHDTHTLVIGHEHPAITISDGIRSELYKSYLVGTYERRRLIVQPSCNVITEGSDVTREKLMSPYLREGVLDFEVYVVGADVYHFGTAYELLRKRPRSV